MSERNILAAPFLAAIIAAGICVGMFYAETKERDSVTTIYKVTGPQGPEIRERLVRAHTKSGAVKFASAQHFAAEAASHEDVARLVKAGADIEDATDTGQQNVPGT